MATGADDDDERTRPDRTGPSTAAPAPAASPFRIGPYTVLGTLGRGAMGMVYAAYDEKLDRKVALKLLHSLQDTGTTGRGRMQREAQALARVSHPNVVQIYEVGEHDREIYIAMEFVRGETLRQWLAARPRRWRDVLGVFLQAGHGLAAAHAAGLVHRDFKPDNVMIGADGRVRVMDFGLARTLANAGPAADVDVLLRTQDPAISPTLTAEGTILGTPAYMAPEQYAGSLEIDAPADQFAFCVALFEGLYGQRPFAGANLRELAAHVRRGEIREPPRRSVPRWLRRIVVRGLAVAPAQRWPDMAALLRRIERGQAFASLRVATAVLAVASLVALAGWAWRRADLAGREAACVAAGADLDTTWNDSARDRLRQAFAASGTSDPDAAAERAMPWLDRHADAWRLARGDACRAHDLRGAWDDATLERALWCLDERRMEFETLVAELVQADRAVLQKAIPAAAGLDPVTVCTDPDALARLPVPPAATRDEAREIRGELARASNLHAAGKFAAAADVTRPALARAEVLDWPPLTAAVRLRLGLALDRQAKFADAARELEDAGFLAMEAGALGVAADAAIALVTLVGQRQAKFDDGLRWSRLAALALRELEPRPGLRTAVNLQGIATVRVLKGDLAGARALQEQALALQEAELGPDHPQVAATLQGLATNLNNLAAYPEALAASARSLAIRESVLGPQHSDVARSLTNQGLILRRMGDYPGSLALHERAAAICEQALGPDHPDLAVILTNVANMHLLLGSIDASRGPQERALAIREQALGPAHPEVAGSLSNLAIYWQQVGDHDKSFAMHTRALAIREELFGPEHREVANSLINLGGVNINRGARDVARVQLERALAILEKLAGTDHPDVANVLSNLAALDHDAGRHAAAEAKLRRIVTVLERAHGPTHPSLADPLLALARVLLAQGRPGDAVSPATRAVALFGPRPPADGAHDPRFVLARALWDAPDDAGRDRDQALAHARAARDHLRAAKAPAAQLADVDRWLASRRR